MKTRGVGWTALAVVAALASTGVSGAAVAAPGPSTQSEHARIIEFWTHARVAQAKPRDFVFDPPSHSFRPTARAGGGGKPGGGGSTTSVLGASWTKGGAVVESTGKVLFSLGGSYYLCSASVVDDSVAGRSIILTAAHCTYDETNGGFAENWTFIPNYDAAPAPLSTSDAGYCDDTKWGCWTAFALVVSNDYATAGGFNDQAVQHDYAFAVVGSGGHENQELDGLVGGQGIQFSLVFGNPVTYLFGYPAAQKYKGNDLVYCSGPLGLDPNTGNSTYRVGCNMTGGSSGGPWFSPFGSPPGEGTLMSVNSYGYSGVTAMHGPQLNSETQGMFGVALGADESVLY